MSMGEYLIHIWFFVFLKATQQIWDFSFYELNGFCKAFLHNRLRPIFFYTESYGPRNSQIFGCLVRFSF